MIFFVANLGILLDKILIFFPSFKGNESKGQESNLWHAALFY